MSQIGCPIDHLTFQSAGFRNHNKIIRQLSRSEVRALWNHKQELISEGFNNINYHIRKMTEYVLDGLSIPEAHKKAMEN